MPTRIAVEDAIMLKVGIAGLGFMGKSHLEIYQAMGDKARVTAIAEPDPKKRAGDMSSVVGNIDSGKAGPSFAGIAMYESLDKMLAESDIDVVDITLPTFMHRDATVKAFAAGRHVICEKPMALEHGEATDMVDASEKAGRRLFVGQCVRFWPAYVKARDLALSGDFGSTRTASFSRLSAIPGWVWENWSLNPALSGGAALDLHIHDTDFIVYLYGRPLGVTSFTGGRKGLNGPVDHISTCYHYGDDMLVTAVGAWEYPSGYPFSMTFSIHMEKGTLHLAADGKLSLYRDGKDPEDIPVKAGDGWTEELHHFIDCIAGGTDSKVLSARDAAYSVWLVRREMESARAGARMDARL